MTRPMASQMRKRIQVMMGNPAMSRKQKITLSAPISGKILEMSVAAGEYKNDTNTPVMTIADLSTVWMSASVPETRIRYIDVGEAVYAEFSAYPGEVFRARVMRIADTVDAQTRTIKVDAEIPNPAGRLRPAMFGQIHHVHDPVPKPSVPVAAVIEASGIAMAMPRSSAPAHHDTRLSIDCRNPPRLRSLMVYE